MSVEIKGLADTVRKAKVAISKASDSAKRLEDSANRVTGTLAQVDDMTKQLDAANDDLTAAVGLLSNGGPPLEDTATSATVIPAVSLTGSPPIPTVHDDTGTVLPIKLANS